MAQAISATTKGKIQGSAPYIKFDGEEQAESAYAHMFSIKLSDGRYYAPTDAQVRNGGTVNFNNINNLIKLPVLGQTVADIETLIPSPSQSISLTDLIITNNNWRDDDGDGQGPNGVYITPTTGELKMELRDNKKDIFDRRDPLDLLCGEAPRYEKTTYYKLSFSAPTYQLMTQYGMPSKEAIAAGITVNYYINPNIDRPKVCSIYTSESSYNRAFHFKVDSDTTKNFPRTGFHGAYFLINVGGETVDSIIKATEDTPGSGSITQGGVTMKLTKFTELTSLNKDIIIVSLVGPNDETDGGTFTPSTFTLKSGVYNNPLYSFALSKWFISSKANKGNSLSDVESYCQRLKGNYRIPSAWEFFSNVKDKTQYREVGNGKRMGIIDANDDGKGGLSPEWGVLMKDSYPNSDWSTSNNATFLTSDRDSNGDFWEFQVSTGSGGFLSVSPTDYASDAVCVMP